MPSPPADDFRSMMQALSTGTMELDECPQPFVDGLGAMMKRSRAELQRFFVAGRAREAGAPQVGSLAPDFSLERLDAKGVRTGERERISEYRGRPVALVFGSYT